MAKRIVNNERTRFVCIGTKPLAKNPISVVLPTEADEFVRSLPNRTEWLRQAIVEKIEREAKNAS